MTDRWSEYAELRRKHPEHFANPPDAAVEILTDPAEVRAAEQAKADLLRSNGLPTEWSATGVVHQDEYGILVRDPVRFTGGRLGTYVRSMPASGADGVVLLPVLDGAVILVEHFRHATRRWHLEAPRGFGEAGVPAEEKAARELREEIGVAPTRLVDLGEMHVDTGTATDAVRLFLAEIPEVGAVEAAEGIRSTVAYPPERVGELIRDGLVTDSFTIAAWTRAWLRGLLTPGPA
ncbi:NUDIX hydrolase [Micromonospora endolithica]|uniref:NUDIX hydrolase n=1 Tax=Micromonospora endolithica TaxID=230091 RepID=A0A3A9ZRY2_9ACTN|nr:NUDIX hydrolase [Micromonospora endolithica]RKN51032.1 NUDIX hydrolase [Micromonospora endolithica]TWJ20171.1 ADP-ribose pyrophosphatase [Micromonospora endolithica]